MYTTTTVKVQTNSKFDNLPTTAPGVFPSDGFFGSSRHWITNDVFTGNRPSNSNLHCSCWPSTGKPSGIVQASSVYHWTCQVEEQERT